MVEAITQFPVAEAFAKAGPEIQSCWLEEVTTEPEEWLVERLLPRRSYTGMFGRRGAAKSFLALHLACCGALGEPFLGEEVERFGTLYCVGEKKARFGKRVEAWKLANNRNRIPMGVRLRWGVPNLLDDAEVEAFIQEVSDLKPAFAQRGAPLGLLAFDTLARCLKHANVSDPDAVGTALEAMQRIIDRCGVTVMPMAHMAKSAGSESQKGAGEWEDAADALIRIERKDDKSPLRIVTLTKQSDEADGLAYGFELEVVDVGATPRGRRVTSCVVRQVDLPESDGTRTKPVSAPMAMVLAALGQLEDAGQTRDMGHVRGVKPGTRGVTHEALREAAYDKGLNRPSMPAEDAPQKQKTQWADTRRKAFQRAVEKLIEARKVRVEGDFVWRL